MSENVFDFMGEYMTPLENEEFKKLLENLQRGSMK